MDEDQRNVRIQRAIELFNSLEPEDGAESMLATQMVATHFAAMECLRRVARPGQTFEGRDVNLKHAQKLMALYTKQLETLNKNRGKGQQKVTVEHVNVAPGGQAIVGHVQTGQRSEEGGPVVPCGVRRLGSRRGDADTRAVFWCSDKLDPGVFEGGRNGTTVGGC